MKSKYASLISQNNSNNQKLNHLNVSTYNNYTLNQFTSTPKKIGEKTKQAIKSIKAKFKKTYYNDNTVYNSRIINDIIFNEKSTTVATFKDFLIFDDNSEFLKRFYKKTELRERLLKIYSYYNEYSKIFPNYIILSEAKYIYKNIQRKQRMIDNQQIIEMKAKKKTNKKKNINDEEELSGDVFNTQIVDSIMNLSCSRFILNETQEFLIQEFKSLGNNGFAVGNKRKVSVDSINNLIEVIEGKRTIEPGSFNKNNLNSNTKSSSVSKVFDRKMFKDKTGHIKLVNNKFNSAFNTINSNSNSNNNIKNNNTLLGSTNTTALNQINHSKHTSEVISSSNNFNDPAFQSVYSNSKEIKEANNKGSSITNGFNRKSSVEQGNMSKRGFNLNKISSPNNNEKVEKGNLRLSMNKLNYEHYGISGLSSNSHNNNNNINNNGLTVSQFNNKIPNFNVNNPHSILNLNNLPNNQDVKRMPLSKRDSTNTIEANNNYNSNPNSNINSASNTMYSKSKVLNSNTVRSLKQNKNMFNKPGVMPPIIQTSNNNKTKEGFFIQTPYNRNNRDSKDKGNFNSNNTKSSTLSNNFNSNTNNNYTHHNNQTPLSGSNTANNANFNTINYNSNYYNSINNNTPLSNNNITNNTTSTYNNSNTQNAHNNNDTNIVGSNNNTGIVNSQPIQNNIIYIINQNSNNNVNVYNIHHQIRKSESQIYVENNNNKEDKLKNSNIKKDSIPSSSIGKVKKLIINDTKLKDASNNSTNLVNTQKQTHYKNQSLQNANSLVNSTNNKLGNFTPNNTVKLKINAEKVIKNLKEKTSILEANVHFKNKLKTIDYSELEAHNKKPLLDNSNNNENNSNEAATNKLLHSVNKLTIQANTTAKDNKVKARIINVERTNNNNNRNIHFKDNSQDYLFRNSSMKFKTINPESTTNNNRNKNILDSTKHIKHGSIKDIKTSTHSKLASMGNIATNVNDLHFNPVTHQKTNSMSVRNKKK